MEDALKRLGLNEQYEDKNGCYWETIESFLWGEVLGFCCCGDPDSELKTVKAVLESIDANVPLRYGYPAIYLYLFDKEKLTTHGFSIYSCKLTQKGKDFLAVLQSIKL